jgi:hypothetical protein
VSVLNSYEVIYVSTIQMLFFQTFLNFFMKYLAFMHDLMYDFEEDDQNEH